MKLKANYLICLTIRILLMLTSKSNPFHHDALKTDTSRIIQKGKHAILGSYYSTRIDFSHVGDEPGGCLKEVDQWEITTSYPQEEANLYLITSMTQLRTTPAYMPPLGNTNEQSGATREYIIQIYRVLGLDLRPLRYKTTFKFLTAHKLTIGDLDHARLQSIPRSPPRNQAWPAPLQSSSPPRKLPVSSKPPPSTSSTSKTRPNAANSWQSIGLRK